VTFKLKFINYSSHSIQCHRSEIVWRGGEEWMGEGIIKMKGGFLAIICIHN